MFKVLRSLFRRSTITPTAVDTALVTLPPNLIPDASPSPNPVTPIFADTETTGLNRDGADEVLEIAIVDAEGTTLLNTLVRPVRNTAWPNAQAVHGISPQDVVNAPTWAELLPKIASICAGKTVVFYNAPFDMSFFPAGFFPSVSCAMRRYSDVSPTGNTWVKLSDAAAGSGYVSSGAYHRALEDTFACRHIWLFGIPELEKAYPSLTNPRITAELASEAGTGLPLIFNTLYQDELKFVTINDHCRLWTKDDREEITVYRPRTLGGNGKIATLPKADNPELTRRLTAGDKIALQLRARDNDVLLFDVLSLRQKKREITELPDRPVEFSPIDDDIFKCFIANRSGICGAIGEWEDFYKVESEIARICKDRGGRYYKTRAKSARFAIIFDPYSHTADTVWSLQQAGYKVTKFDQVVVQFGLTHLWDCPRYLAYVDSLKHYVDNPM
ncbi:3'-5' exonuclease [Candidimonas sp. SYP-B2681]|nr:3'-5' exonuclease [Candidimonas sp. SYP-B2681]